MNSLNGEMKNFETMMPIFKKIILSLRLKPGLDSEPPRFNFILTKLGTLLKKLVFVTLIPKNC